MLALFHVYLFFQRLWCSFLLRLVTYFFVSLVSFADDTLRGEKMKRSGTNVEM